MSTVRLVFMRAARSSVNLTLHAAASTVTTMHMTESCPGSRAKSLPGRPSAGGRRAMVVGDQCYATSVERKQHRRCASASFRRHGHGISTVGILGLPAGHDLQYNIRLTLRSSGRAKRRAVAGSLATCLRSSVWHAHHER